MHDIVDDIVESGIATFRTSEQVRINKLSAPASLLEAGKDVSPALLAFAGRTAVTHVCRRKWGLRRLGPPLAKANFCLLLILRSRTILAVDNRPPSTLWRVHDRSSRSAFRVHQHYVLSHDVVGEPWYVFTFRYTSVRAKPTG